MTCASTQKVTFGIHAGLDLASQLVCFGGCNLLQFGMHASVFRDACWRDLAAVLHVWHEAWPLWNGIWSPNDRLCALAALVFSRPKRDISFPKLLPAVGVLVARGIWRSCGMSHVTLFACVRLLQILYNRNASARVDTRYKGVASKWFKHEAFCTVAFQLLLRSGLPQCSTSRPRGSPEKPPERELPERLAPPGVLPHDFVSVIPTLCFNGVDFLIYLACSPVALSLPICILVRFGFPNPGRQT